eukprot:jgi/Astpho2/8732/Aster-05294
MKSIGAPMFKVALLLLLGSFAAHAARQKSGRLLQDDTTILAVKGGPGRALLNNPLTSAPVAVTTTNAPTTPAADSRLTALVAVLEVSGEGILPIDSAKQAKLLLALADLMTTVTNPRSNILVAGAKTVSTTATVAPTTTPEATTAAPTTAAPTTAAPKVTTAAPKAPATTTAPTKGSVVVGRRRQLLQGTQEVADMTVEVDMGSGNAAAVSGASDQLASIANSGLLRSNLFARGVSLGSIQVLSSQASLPGLTSVTCRLNSNNECAGSSSDTGKIVGIIVGVVAAVVLCMLILIVVLLLRRRRLAKQSAQQPVPKQAKDTEGQRQMAALNQITFKKAATRAAPSSPSAQFDGPGIMVIAGGAQTGSPAFGRQLSEQSARAAPPPSSIAWPFPHAEGCNPLLQANVPPTDEEPETPRLGGTPRMQTQTSGPLRSPRVSGSPTALGGLVKKLSGAPLGPQRNTVWEAARIEVEQRRRTEAEDSLREQIDKGTLKDRAVDLVADDVQHRTDYFRSQGKDAPYFRHNIDFLQNKGKDVVIFDVESWQQWRDVFSLWLEVHYPQTSDLYEMQRYQAKLLARQQSLPSSQPSSPIAARPPSGQYAYPPPAMSDKIAPDSIPPGPLAQAMSARSGFIPANY